GPDPRPFLPGHSALLHNIEELEAAASGIGINSFSVDRDGVLRRLPLLFQVEGYNILPGASIELLRVAQGESTIQIRSTPAGIQSITVGDTVVPTNANGEIWLAFSPIRADRMIPAASLLAGTVRPEQVEGKLAIIGSTATGLKDFRATPVAAAMPGPNILAQTIEGIIDGSYLKRPDAMVTVEVLILLAIGSIVIWAIPRLDVIGNIGLSVGFALLLIGTSWALFVGWELLLDWSFPVLAATIINITLMFMKYGDERRARQLVRQQLTLVQQEMEAARRVQQAILPTAFPNTASLQLHAGTWPAREVGGDFYDILRMPDGRIGFAVADVSGKGMDAALFMAVARTLLKAYAHTTSDPGGCLERLNEDLAEDNDACMFVTVFYGVIDPATGRVEFANGGHNPPYLKRADGRVEPLAAEGFAVGVVPGAFYQTKTTRLEPGDAIILYTDGVTEAFSPAGEEFTDGRLHDLLSATEVERAEPLVRRIVDCVNDFVGEGTQSDDITCMAVVYRHEAATAAVTADAVSA
ncbi:MAG: SpoIIE family protein phosphatase, partial [Geminicoccaceae bacterium]|nr:SpoIIE family protein phosphatase [Geminicoccaceae bacterium]